MHKMALKLSTTAMIAIACAFSAAPASAASGGGVANLDTVKSASGLPVTATNGTCVRTRWMVEGEPCTMDKYVERQVERTKLSTAEREVYFDFDSASLSAKDQAELNAVSKRLRDAKDVKRAEIVGYADRIGNTQYNMNLSKQRAAVVANYLQQQGYLNTHIAEVRAVGESKPGTNCGDLPREQLIQCLGPDRKVDIEIVYEESAKPTAMIVPADRVKKQ